MNNKKVYIVFICLMLIQVVYYKILIINTDSRTLASMWVNERLVAEPVNVLRYGEYFPVIENPNVNLVDVDEFFYNDLAGKDYPQYIIWSNYNVWPKDLGTKDWQKIEDRSNKDGEIGYFSGFMNLGPNIAIYHPNW